MIKRILHKNLYHQHSWRELAFDELNQIYAAMLVRGLSISMVGLFVPVFMTRLGYNITQVLIVIVSYFTVRIFFDVIASYLVAWFGPKHTMIFGQILFAISSAQFLTLNRIVWPLWLLGFVWGASQSCFYVPFDVNFSKIRHSKHGGKELGYVEIMGKIGAIFGPLLGGVISIVFGSRYIFAVSTVLLVGGLLPMLKTPEPTNVKVRPNYKNFDASKIVPHLPSFIGMGLEMTLTSMLWPLYMSIFVLPDSNVFIKIGILSSVSAVITIIIAKKIGHLVDEGYGGTMLKIGAYINAVLYIGRAFIGSYLLAFTANLTSEVATLTHRLPFMKAYYDHVDASKSERIVFVSVITTISSVTKAVIYSMLLMLSTVTTGRLFFVVASAIAAGASVLVTLEKFKHTRRSGKKGLI
ncbi:MFS transporter [Candidatus Saccharibacteria bacterium]|nr:MFS transporter [Candidatus Saccharibacteria bacterium]